MMRASSVFPKIVLPRSVLQGALWATSFGLIASNSVWAQGNAGTARPPQQNFNTQQQQQPGSNQRNGAGQPTAPQQGAVQQGAPQQGNLQQGNPQQGNPQQGALQGAQGQVPPVPAPGGRPPLNPQEQAYVDSVLQAWQQSTMKITKYQCDFKRWEFNPAVNSENIPQAVGNGQLRFMKPDKAMFKEEVHEELTRDPKGNKVYKQFPDRSGDWWLCDGESIFKFDRDEKQVERHRLPPEMKGMQIAESPLPFVFGIDAVKVKQRYWVEIGKIPNGPDGKPRQDLVVLDAYPKRADDASNYQKVTIFLNRSKVLPDGIIIYDLDWTPNNPHYQQFEFTNHDVFDSIIDKLKERVWLESFIPNPPRDFKIVEMPYQSLPDSAPQSPQPGPRTATPTPTSPANR